MNLVKATPAHIPELVAISKAAFHSDAAVGGSGSDGPPGYDSEAWHIDMMEQGHLFTAIWEDTIIGGALLFPDAQAPAFMYVGRIFIAPHLFRQGCGAELMAKIEALHPEVHLWCLDTPIWNERTNRFYRKLGYVETRRDDEMVYYQKSL